MKREHVLTSIFFVIAAIFIYLFYELVIPFFAPIMWAAVFVIIFFPLYEKLRKKIKSKGLCSLIMTSLILFLILGPVAYLLGALVSEAITAVTKVNAMIKSGELDQYMSFNLPWLQEATTKISEYFDLSKINLDEIIKESIQNVSSVILNQTSWLITNATQMIFNFVLMIFTMYYFFKDGERIIEKIKRLMPLTEQQITTTFHQLRDVIQATMYGSVTVALIQGLLGGILFAAVGIPSAVFWGAIMAFLSIIPFLGAFVIFIPAGLILIIGGSVLKGILVILIGTLFISQVDNLLRPYLISGKTELHPLMLFFAILGGIYLFNLLGAVLGPLIAAIFVTIIKLLEISLHPESGPMLSTKIDAPAD